MSSKKDMAVNQLLNNSLLLLNLIKDFRTKGRQCNETLFKCFIARETQIFSLSPITFQITKNLFLRPFLDFHAYIEMSAILNNETFKQHFQTKRDLRDSIKHCSMDKWRCRRPKTCQDLTQLVADICFEYQRLKLQPCSLSSIFLLFNELSLNFRIYFTHNKA